MFQFLTCAILAGFVGDGVTAKFVPEGVTQKVGGYSPIRAEMDQEASIVTKAPEDLVGPKYGYLVFGDKKFAFIVDAAPEGEEGKARLFVDSNADGDLTNDPASTWEPNKRGELTMYAGSTQVELADGQVGKVSLYRFDPNDESRPQLKETVLFYGDFGTEFSFELDGKEFSTFTAGVISDGDSMWIDRDNNGKRSYRFETVEVGEPFNFTGTTYVFSVDNSTLSLAKADSDLPQKALPPDLAIGKKALPFTATTTDGTDIDFPKSYAGKIVMLDFWATWCGPCIGEIPNMKTAYADWHDKGFEILGISFDRENMEEKLKEFTEEKELPWPQIYDGKGWENKLGLMHDVSGIPFVLLVDGDSGEILATSRELRGEGLSELIGETLEKKNK